MKVQLVFLYRWLEHQRGYSLIQKVGRPTVLLFKELIRTQIQTSLKLSDKTLDLACGVGNYREMLPCNYFGIDINANYVAEASKKHANCTFLSMDCTKLEFPSDTFDHVVTIAATHHLSKEELIVTLNESIRVTKQGGSVHILDAILPMNPLHFWKQIWFRLDRGQFPRYAKDLLTIAASVTPISKVITKNGPLHDVAYIRIDKPFNQT